MRTEHSHLGRVLSTTSGDQPEDRRQGTPARLLLRPTRLSPHDSRRTAAAPTLLELRSASPKTHFPSAVVGLQTTAPGRQQRILDAESWRA